MTILQFDNFEMDIQGRSLRRNGDTIRIGARAFDLLATLALRAGDVLSKSELLSAVWPETHVEESSLRVNIVAVRKALDDQGHHRIVENVSGRGYTFTVPVRKSPGQRVRPMPKVASALKFLPGSVQKLVGRDDIVKHWCSDIRCGTTTIVGQGGIGKTAVAVQIAQEIQDTFESVHFVDFADRSNSSSSSLAIALQSDEPLHAVLRRAVESVAGQSVLIVLDGCEISIERAAFIAEAIADRNPKALILATSREPLGIIGEKVLHLSGLAAPCQGQRVDRISDFSGIELFAEKVSMVAEDCVMDTAAKMEMAAEIVRKTDGNPLAIELAASRVSDLGLENLMSCLDRPLRTLRRGNRTSPTRQQSLRANMDWSYDLLRDDERFLLVRLSALDGGFTKEAALITSVSFDEIDSVEEAFDGLVVKSLIVADMTAGKYFLTRLIREYAREKLLSGLTDRVKNKAAEMISSFCPRPAQPNSAPLQAGHPPFGGLVIAA